MPLLVFALSDIPQAPHPAALLFPVSTTTPTPISPAGILVIDKPLGPTSMNICANIRWRLKRGGAPKRVKVGHGGTLDPLASGVLVILVGSCTRLCDQIMAGEKGYETTIDLSAFTDTDDAEGARTPVIVPTPPTREVIESVLPRFTGEILQTPPIYSAIHVDGQRAYDLARAGKSVELKPRPVQIQELRVLAYEWPKLTLLVRCGKGTYIRSLARDLGVALGTGGTLAALRRTRVGRFLIEDARTMASLPEVLTQADLLAMEVS